jgi:hypothetical protein
MKLNIEKKLDLENNIMNSKDSTLINNLNEPLGNVLLYCVINFSDQDLNLLIKSLNIIHTALLKQKQLSQLKKKN